MISIHALSKRYPVAGGEHIALNNINLDIKSGEIFAIIGSSGAGKSTLMRMINQLEKPSEGSVKIDGVELSQLNEQHLRSHRNHIAMIFQQFNLLSNKTVYENIALPLDIQQAAKETYDHIPELLRLVELEDKHDHYPNQLSGGQKQRVAIARALATQPKLLLCDEATSALDPKTTQEVLRLLKKINKILGLTIVLITHEMDVVKEICDRFALLEKGQIQEVSSLSEIFDSPHAKHLLMDSIRPQLPNSIKLSKTPTEKNAYPIYQLYFYGEITKESLISQLSVQYDVQMNIIQANIGTINDNVYGILILQIEGTPECIKQAIKALELKQVQMERLGYVV